MKRETLRQNLFQLVYATENCIEKQFITPALILIYTGIDIAGWLDAESDDTPVQESFIGWAQRYLLSAKPLPCTAIELYSARCGLLHTLTPDSRLSTTGDARWFNKARALLKEVEP